VYSCQCGSRSRVPGCLSPSHPAFLAPKDEELVGHGAGLRVAEPSRLEYIIIDLSADIAEPSYRLTVRAARRAQAGENIIQSTRSLRLHAPLLMDIQLLGKVKLLSCLSRSDVHSWHRPCHGNTCATKHREYNEVEGTHDAAAAVVVRVSHH
jgi:hypothetical protein